MTQENEAPELPPLEPEFTQPVDEEITTEIETDLASPEQEQLTGKKFGTFNGVIRPTVLTILGVMMYLREGWVVGNAGLGGAILIILTAYFITGTTALSLSSITTNIRLGAGGIFSIATQSLGLELGGSIGIPFYLAQSLSTAMYIYGFMEGWLAIFPTHSPALVVTIVFVTIFLLSYISTSLAFRAQILVMTGVVLALGSIFLGLRSVPELQKVEIIGQFDNASFWTLFAVFFPASTGIMVGASMSGNLRNPRRSIPIGTMTAWGITLVVYLAMAIWYALVATPEDLRTNYAIAVDRAYWGPAVLIGILSSCYTAALSSFVASPRTLQSLGQHRIVPFSDFFGKIHMEEPRNAILFTGILVLGILFLGDLNTIAQVVTVFFLMTYFTINFILLIETKLNLISFRPTFRLHIAIPLLGSFACLSAIVIVSPFVGLFCILLSMTIYFYLDRRSLDNPYESLNSGLFTSIANWAARHVLIKADMHNLRSWKPGILAPIERTTQIEGNFHLLRAITYPQGSVHIIGMHSSRRSRLLKNLDRIEREIHQEGIFASSAKIESTDFLTSLDTTAAVMRSFFFRPNILFLPIEERTQDELRGISRIAKENELGIVFIAKHPDSGFGKHRYVNLWVRDQSPNWHLSFDLANIDLPLLLAYKLIRNWNIKLRLITLVSKEKDIENARHYLSDLMVLARMPRGYEIRVEKADLKEFIEDIPRADINIFGLGQTIDKDYAQKLVKSSESTCLFVKDSGFESILV